MKKTVRLGDSIKIVVERVDSFGRVIDNVETTVILTVQNIFCNTGNAIVAE